MESSTGRNPCHHSLKVREKRERLVWYIYSVKL
jgi:hypothetical protein